MDFIINNINKKYIIIKSAKTNNLKNIDVEIELGKMITVTGD